MLRVLTSHDDGKDMIRAPNATEVSHLFALAEHEIVKGRFTEALILLRFIRSIDPEHTDAAARLAGLVPGAIMVAVLLTVSVLAVSRLPATLFAAERKPAAD